MSKPKAHEPVKLVVSVFSQTQELITEATKELSKKFGSIDFISEVLPFESTSYYEKEMGKGLTRRFFSFNRMVLPDTLPQIKLYTNKIEEHFSDNQGNRRLNIDPGYISLSHLILATGKGYAHRPYLRDGIHADLTLIYEDKSFHVLEWTYPDYGSKDIIELMNTIRKKYVLQLSELKRKVLC
ncbi:MAG: DUF4416 family protein [Pseudomonadota bacterium]